MRWFPKLFVLLLLAFWLPATEHCALEMAGVIATTCHDHGGVAGQPCSTDGCSSLESAHYRLTAQVFHVSAPALHEALCCVWLAIVAPPPVRLAPPLIASQERPLDWVPTWHFVRRAAPPSRAPTSLCA